MYYTRNFLCALVAALLLTVGGTAFGQADSDSNTMDVKVTILNPISVNWVSDLDFGTVISGAEYTIGADQGDAGHFTVDATANEDVILKFTAPTDLGDANVIFKDGEHAYHLGGIDQQSATVVQDLLDNTITPTVPTFGVWIGGTLDVTNASPGDYTATFTLEVEYVN